MSLFGNGEYQWRETYFIMFRQGDKPSAKDVIAALTLGNDRHLLTDVQADDHGRFESLTLRSPDDCSAMDITFVTGDEVAEQIEELSKEIAKSTLNEEGHKKLLRLQQCDARYDIFHFEHITAEGEEDEGLDPGSLIIVLKRLAKLCHGIGVDPQSGTLT